jgi:hypothetical protein
MKAIVYHEYGSADVLKLEEVRTPTPGDKEVLIKVRAAAVNPLDWHLMRGVPGCEDQSMRDLAWMQRETSSWWALRWRVLSLETLYSVQSREPSRSMRALRRRQSSRSQRT